MHKIINTFIEEKQLENLSNLTINSYKDDLRKFNDFCTQNNLTMTNGLNEYSKFLESTTEYLSSTNSRKLVTIKLFHKYLIRNNLITYHELPSVKKKKRETTSKNNPFIGKIERNAFYFLLMQRIAQSSKIILKFENSIVQNQQKMLFS